MIAREVVDELRGLQNSQDAAFLQRFFKTGPGEYGEGDCFLGIRVPVVRAVAKRYIDTPIDDLEHLLGSKWHEVRLLALVIMTKQYAKADSALQKALYSLYVSQIGKGINNWDLVDVSCPRIVGAYLYDKDRSALYNLAKGGLWHKRVSVISTFAFIAKNDMTDAYALCGLLVNERHDLLQKAVGWTLRELGKKDQRLLFDFLNSHAATMPRTMLRYSIEKLTAQDKHHYMTLKTKRQNIAL